VSKADDGRAGRVRFLARREFPKASTGLLQISHLKRSSSLELRYDVFQQFQEIAKSNRSP